ncbi:uncharacterized protein LOC108911667 [Anoplophora glabripennis]|uniref:uncharacterized protein LOC108911667 n=1 Tax=Anoplophora glabripennis TaxID=217634 RepID=UPI0008743242|nr:uncharacterized protein LOC108911667 [Anoplophora glabripennis]
MSSEIEVSETPNWLQELEDKRERRLKARLGHETGAGAPCLKCGEKCPGLDLHFWRKCCKICKCSKEEHEVQDDDIYGWAQFQLLGSKPNKIKRKIKLPGKKDELELDWTPKGHNETVDKYLKTLPPEQLPVKGSQAAQDRKQLLQKQIPIHDIDPTLCHELSNDELKQMNDYISHVKQTSVGVGQIVSLSNIIKANLHMLNPSEAALIASRYPKGIPLSEIVKLHSQNRANALKPQGVNEKLEKLNLQEPTNKMLPKLKPNVVSTTEVNLNPWVSNNVRDINYPGYTKDTNQVPTNAQFSVGLKSRQSRNYIAGSHPDQNIPPTIDENLLQNLNFNPKNVPSQFIQQSGHHAQPYPYKVGQQNVPTDERTPGNVSNQPNSAFAPYNKTSGYRPGERYIGDSPSRNPNYTSNVPRLGSRSPSGYRQSEVPGSEPETSFMEDLDQLHPNFAKHLAKYPSGHKKDDQEQNFGTPAENNALNYENVGEMRKNNGPGLPSYVPGKYNVVSEMLTPTKVGKNLKDLAFGTYNPNDLNSTRRENTNEENAFAPPNLAYENYPPGYFDNKFGENQLKVPTGRYPDYKAPLDENVPHDQNLLGQHEKSYPSDNIPAQGPNVPFDIKNSPYDQNLRGLKPGQYTGPNDTPPNLGLSNPYTQNVPYQQPYQGGNVPTEGINVPYDQNSSGLRPGQYIGPNDSSSNLGLSNPYTQNVPYEQPYPGGNVPTEGVNVPYDQNSSRLRPGQYAGPGNSPSKVPNPDVPLAPYDPYHPGGVIPSQQTFSPGAKPTKKLSELHPGKINIDEDYLQPSQVTIGAIQDIDYPEIKAATQGTNDFYEDYSPDSLREILNNVKLPDCHYCKKPFEENEFAVTIDRANVLFHAQCFKCAGCNQILADNVYFYNKETDNVYCGRDYAKVRGFPRCKACDELIFTKEYCLAENSTFHLKHFCCIECDKPLAGQDYTLEDEMPYCLPCFEHSKASKCSSCGKVIKPDEVGCSLNTVHFHAVDECFACKVCKKPLMGKKLLLRNEKLYCSHDCFGTDRK